MDPVVWNKHILFDLIIFISYGFHRSLSYDAHDADLVEDYHVRCCCCCITFKTNINSAPVLHEILIKVSSVENSQQKKRVQETSKKERSEDFRNFGHITTSQGWNRIDVRGRGWARTRWLDTVMKDCELRGLTLVEWRKKVLYVEIHTGDVGACHASPRC